jgi:hypothetical protein
MNLYSRQCPCLLANLVTAGQNLPSEDNTTIAFLASPILVTMNIILRSVASILPIIQPVIEFKEMIESGLRE